MRSYVRDKIKFEIKEELSLFDEYKFESIFIEAEIKDKPTIIGEIYRVPNTSELESLQYFDTIINKVQVQNKNIVIGTDQNFDYLNISTENHNLELLNKFISGGLIPTITKPTRDTTATLIDNIYARVNNHNQLRSGITCNNGNFF